MSVIEEFGAFHGMTYSASTRRVYLSAAKKALQILGETPGYCGSYEELLSSLRSRISDKRSLKEVRIAPFLRFLESRTSVNTIGQPDYESIRTWMVDRIGKETKAAREASHYVRRDLAMLVGLCVAPGKGSPRRWPKSALIVARQREGFTVKLWGNKVEEQGFAMALLYWHTWRERLDRPEQGRIYRQSWAYSNLLFPGSNGEPLTKHAVRNALLRLVGGDDRPAGLTPGMIRQAFVQLEG
jgi:hypothetical protein